MVDRAKRLAHDTDAWIIEHRWSRIARRAIMGFMQHGALQNAGSMAYFAILSVFQLLVLAVVVVSFFLGEGAGRDFVIEQVDAGTPMDAETVTAVIDGIIASRGGIGVVSFVLLLWGALGVFSALNRGIASAFVAAEPRGFVQDKLIGLALISITGLLGVSSVVIGLVTGVLQQVASDVLGGIPGAGLALWLFGLIVPILLIFGAFLAVYRLTPNRPVSLKEIWPGAVVATILWTVLRVGFTWYTTDVASYDTAFGPISTAISLLVFLYFASVVVLLGAEVARASVLDSEVPAPRPILADEYGSTHERTRPAQGGTEPEAGEGQAQPGGAGRGEPTGRETPSSRRLPGWALAVGGAATAALLRWLSSREGRHRGV